MKERFDYNKMDDLLRGSLNEANRRTFHEKMQQESELQESYQFYKKTSQIVKIKALLNEVEEGLEQRGFFDEYKTQTSLPHSRTRGREARVLSFRKTFAIAASICLLVIASMFGYAHFNYSNTALAGINPESIVFDSGVRSAIRGQDEGKTIDYFQAGVVALQEKDYLSAVSFFEKVLSTQDPREDAELYLAYAQFEANDLQNALQTTLPLLDSSSIDIRQKAEWLQVQILLKQDQLDATFFEKMNKIATENRHLFQKDATELQQKLDSPWRKMAGN